MWQPVKSLPPILDQRRTVGTQYGQNGEHYETWYWNVHLISTQTSEIMKFANQLPKHLIMETGKFYKGVLNTKHGTLWALILKHLINTQTWEIMNLANQIPKHVLRKLVNFVKEY